MYDFGKFWTKPCVWTLMSACVKASKDKWGILKLSEEDVRRLCENNKFNHFPFTIFDL